MGLGFVSWVPVAVAALLPAGLLSLALGRWIDRAVVFAATNLFVLVLLAAAWAFGFLDLDTTLLVSMVLAVVTSLVLIHRIDDPAGRWGRAARSRLLMGIPWGTLTVTTFVLLVYLFVQGGWSHWYDPMTIPFRAWSYLYPTGIVTSAFAHNGPGHLVGNLVGTLVLGSLAEYAWGHFPTERGATSFGSRLENPYVRAFVVFPGVVLGVGLVVAAFSMGPVIGFSGVVFAFAGFAVTRYPIATVVGTVGMGATRTTYYALQDPSITAQANPSGPSAPWWAQIAIQGHALGLLAGIVLGWAVFSERSEVSSGLRIWTGVFLFGMAENLWAVYWFGGNETYYLFRGLGIVLVSLLALLVTAALTASENELLGGVLKRSRGGLDRRAETDGGDRGGDGGGFLSNVSRQDVAIGLLLLGVGLLAAPGLGSNLFTAASHDAPDDGVQVGGYTVFYAEDVTNQMVSVVDISFFNQSTQVETSGVIVTNPDRHIWLQAVSKGQLAYSGWENVDVGGIGWRKSVDVYRQGWNVVGGGKVYKVWLQPPAGEKRLAFTSANATAKAVIDGRNVTIAPGEGRFEVVVRGNGSVGGVAPVPTKGNAVRVGGLRIVNRDGSLYAARNRTVVRVAGKETYN